MNSNEVDVKIEKFWNTLSEGEKEIICYLAYMPSPVSIDALLPLSETSSVAEILSFIENLKKYGILHERKSSGRGFYFRSDLDLVAIIEKHTTEDERKRLINRLIGQIAPSSDKADQANMALANIFLRTGNIDEGLPTIKRAARILLRLDRKEEASYYHDRILQYFEKNGVTAGNVGYYLSGVLGKFASSMSTAPIPSQLALLTKAEEVARQYKKWASLIRVKLILSQVLRVAGQDRLASQYMDDAIKLLQTKGKRLIPRKLTFIVCQLLFMKGSIQEAIRQYEERVGSLEQFGDDETTLWGNIRVGFCYVINGRIARGIGMIEAVQAKADVKKLLDIQILALIFTVLSLLEIRKVDEADVCLGKVSSVCKESQPFHMQVIAACKAYILVTREDYAEAFECLKRAADYRRRTGLVDTASSWFLELLSILELRGYSDEQLNLDTEIERALSSDSIHMKGCALRYRAVRSIERKMPSEKILRDLKDSEKYLKQAGAVIDLARTHIALGNYFFKQGEHKLGQALFGKAWLLFSKVDGNLFPKDLLAFVSQDKKVEFMISSVVQINQSLGRLEDSSGFLQTMIDLSMDFTAATRGAFLMRDPKHGMRLIVSRNLDPRFFDSYNIRRLLDDAVKKEKELILLEPSNSNVTPKALQGTGINSLFFIPIKLIDHTEGYLYLDNCLDGPHFPTNLLPYLTLLGTQISLGLSNIKMYEKLRESKDRLQDEALFYKREMGITAPLQRIVGKSQGIRRVLEQVRQVATTDSFVLITGETGVGKELVAKAVHFLSKRKDGPFIPVNLATLPSDLVGSDLFGYEKGAFTGAAETRKGRLELADGGTLFLDEIGDLPLNIQVKLLRVLQEKTFERVGSQKEIHSDFRIVAATNKDLRVAVKNGAFRQDLYYRLSVFPIFVPPLRERQGDIPLLANYFFEKCSKKLGKKLGRISAAEIAKMKQYPWPGNIRELEHFIERTVILSNEGNIAFPDLSRHADDQISADNPDFTTLADMERQYLKTVLARTNWKIRGQNGSAKILGLKPTTLASRMKKLGIKRSSAS